MNLLIRAMGDEDLLFADSLRGAAGWNQTLRDWRRLLRHDPGGAFTAEWNGARAGTVTTTIYGEDLAWIGMLLVHPNFRKRGIGTALLNHAITFLRGKGVRSIKLDATPAGQPIYEQIGFRSEWTLRRWERAAGLEAIRALNRVANLRAATTTDIELIQELDGIAFGRPRPRFIGMLAEDCMAAHCCSQSAGDLSGFLLIREGSRAIYLGLGAAISPEHSEALVTHAVAAHSGQPMFWDIPDENVHAVQIAKSLGFQEQRALTRMVLGDPGATSRLDQMFAITGPETG